ncbi:hypothetical protein Leryth_013693, partial [Lithospermum erythrorhizon]
VKTPFGQTQKIQKWQREYLVNVPSFRSTSAWVASNASHVTIDYSGIENVAEKMKDSIPKVEWDFEGIHYFDNGPLTVQYLFVLDAMNFCFWPAFFLNFIYDCFH